MRYRRRNQWLLVRLVLALFCLPLIWLARVVYLLVGAVEGWGGWRGNANPCAVLCCVVLCYGVGVGAGVIPRVCFVRVCVFACLCLHTCAFTLCMCACVPGCLGARSHAELGFL